MKIKFLRYSPLAFIALACTLLLGSCTKDDEYNNHKGEIESTAGVYVLCEGSFGKNNSDITYYNKNTNVTEKNYYSKVNGKTLGESANDLQRYGSKMYAVVTGLQGSAPSYLEVLDVATCKTIKRISFTAANDGLARGIVFYKNKAYVSRFDGKVSRIDTASLSVDGEITLSGGLDGLAVANGKLYIANSNYYLYPNGKKNVVSVVDLNSFTQTKDIIVTFNPTRVVAANNGDVYVVCGASYLGVTPTIDRISSATDTKVQSITDYSDFGAIGINGNKALVVTEPYTNAVVRQFDASTNKFGSSFITDTKATIATPYGITFNSFDSSVLIGDANNYNATTGKAVYFDSNGKSISTFETAGNPQRAVFIYNYK